MNALSKTWIIRMTAGWDPFFLNSFSLKGAALAKPSFLWGPASFDGYSVRRGFSDPEVGFSPK